MKVKRVSINYTKLWLILILLLAAFLRIYPLASQTEFLGDQGRTGLVIYDAWRDFKLPLHGPPVLTGQFLGPIFYYLIGPAFIIGRFNPLWPAVFTALVGVSSVYLLFWLVKRLTNPALGLLVSVIYAVSPNLVTAERTIWEPNLIPCFVLLYLVTLFKIWNETKENYFFWLGALSSILVQLHYPNLFYLSLTGLFTLIYCFKRKTSFLKLGKIIGLQVSAFLLFLAPFIYYEVNHSWQDIREILLIFLFSGGSSLNLGSLFNKFADYSVRLFGRALPLSAFWVYAVGLCFLFLKRSFWTYWLIFWIVSGIGLMTLYQGVVYDHYLYFLLPLPFILLALFINSFKAPIFQKLFSLGLIIVIVSFLSKTDFGRAGFNDVERSRSAVEEIIRQAAGQTFSFTLLKSRSFSDLHYRYFFRLNKVAPYAIASDDYQYLFLVCETKPCPPSAEIISKRSIPALCFDEHCEGDYPIIKLANYQFIKQLDLPEATVYQFQSRL